MPSASSFFLNESLVEAAPPHNLSGVSEFSSRLQRSHACQAQREFLPQTAWGNGADQASWLDVYSPPEPLTFSFLQPTCSTADGFSVPGAECSRTVQWHTSCMLSSAALQRTCPSLSGRLLTLYGGPIAMQDKMGEGGEDGDVFTRRCSVIG